MKLNNQQKKNVQPRKKGKKKRVQQASKPTGNQTFVRISDCSKQYALALSNPWKCVNPCIPDGITLPSLKFTVFGRTSFTVGTNGVGFCALNPFQMIQNSANIGTNTIYSPYIATLPSYAGTGITATRTGGASSAGYLVQNFATPYNYDYFSNNRSVELRLVGAGIKASYAGTELNLSGRVIKCMAPSGASLPGIQDTTPAVVEDWLLFPRSSVNVERDSRISHFVTFEPGSQKHNSYQPAAVAVADPYENILIGQVYPSSGNNTPFGYCMGICVVGGQANSIYNTEVIAHFEIIGRTGGSSVSSGGGGAAGVGTMGFTPSHSDPVGVGAILSSLPMMLPQGTAESFAGALMKGVKDNILKTSSGLISAPLAKLVTSGAMQGVKLLM